MVLTKERKVLLGLLGSAGLILVVDQLLLGPPQNASANSAEAPMPASPTPAAPTQPTPASTNDLDQSQHLNDKTAPKVAQWNDRLEQIVVASEQSPDDIDPFSMRPRVRDTPTDIVDPETFEVRYVLSAVMTSEEGGIAMVNGKSVRVGQEIAGYRLMRVDARSAEFHAGDRVAVLKLPVRGLGGS